MGDPREGRKEGRGQLGTLHGGVPVHNPPDEVEHAQGPEGGEEQVDEKQGEEEACGEGRPGFTWSPVPPDPPAPFPEARLSK